MCVNFGCIGFTKYLADIIEAKHALSEIYSSLSDARQGRLEEKELCISDDLRLKLIDRT